MLYLSIFQTHLLTILFQLYMYILTLYKCYCPFILPSGVYVAILRSNPTNRVSNRIIILQVWVQFPRLEVIQVINKKIFLHYEICLTA